MMPGGLADALARACDYMEAVARDPAREAEVRQAASAVYNAASAVIMAWEDARMTGGQGDRARLAGLVLTHKLLPRDPLAGGGDGAADADLLERAFHDMQPFAEAAE